MYCTICISITIFSLLVQKNDSILASFICCIWKISVFGGKRCFGGCNCSKSWCNDDGFFHGWAFIYYYKAPSSVNCFYLDWWIVITVPTRSKIIQKERKIVDSLLYRKIFWNREFFQEVVSLEESQSLLCPMSCWLVMVTMWRIISFDYL